MYERGDHYTTHACGKLLILKFELMVVPVALYLYSHHTTTLHVLYVLRYEHVRVCISPHVELANSNRIFDLLAFYSWANALPPRCGAAMLYLVTRDYPGREDYLAVRRTHSIMHSSVYIHIVYKYSVFFLLPYWYMHHHTATTTSTPPLALRTDDPPPAPTPTDVNQSIFVQTPPLSPYAM